MALTKTCVTGAEGSWDYVLWPSSAERCPAHFDCWIFCSELGMKVLTTLNVGRSESLMQQEGLLDDARHVTELTGIRGAIKSLPRWKFMVLNSFLEFLGKVSIE